MARPKTSQESALEIPVLQLLQQAGVGEAGVAGGDGRRDDGEPHLANHLQAEQLLDGEDGLLPLLLLLLHHHHPICRPLLLLLLLLLVSDPLVLVHPCVKHHLGKGEEDAEMGRLGNHNLQILLINMVLFHIEININSG